MSDCTCVLASLGQLCCIAQAEMTLNPLTAMESGSSEARYSALDSGYWFGLLLLLTSTRILPDEQQEKLVSIVKDIPIQRRFFTQWAGMSEPCVVLNSKSLLLLLLLK